MNTITYLFLTEKKFNENSLDFFLRHQEVKECWRKNSNNEYILVPNEYVEDWDLNKRKETAREILNKIKGKGFAYGAFYEERVVGYILVSNELLGAEINICSCFYSMYQNHIAGEVLEENFLS